jgi:hypothetical protein
MHKSGVILTMRDEKTNKVLYETNHRKSKAIKLFLIHSITSKWILKEDVFGIVKNTMQFHNIWEYFKTKNKLQKEDEENGD